MAKLWVAQDEEAGVTVVVKRPQLDDTQETERRFQREVRAAASLFNANIVRVFDYGTDRIGPFLVMEHLVGSDLRGILQTRGPWHPSRVCWALEEIEGALSHAHRRGVIHRDLKPSNLFLTQEGTAERIKVLDFGLAKPFGLEWSGETITREGTLLGSLGYMSPEQSRGQKVDHRTDLWSLSAVLYELLTGFSAFPACHPGERMALIWEGSYVRVSQVSGVLGSSYDDFFERAFQPDRAHRFQSVVELVGAFRRAVTSNVPRSDPKTKTMKDSG